MRRLGLLASALLAAVSLSACSEVDAEGARELLSASDQALLGLRAYRFAGRLWIESDAGDFSFVIRGGGNTRGDSASFLTMRSDDVPGFPEITVVQRGQTMWIRAEGGWTRTEAPAGQPTGLDQFDFSAYVKNVSVDEDVMVDGQPAAKVMSVLDTTGMVEGLFASLGRATGGTGLPLDRIANSFGDTRVVFYLSDATHLPLRTLIDMSIEPEGEKAELHLDFALEPAKRHVRIPLPSAEAPEGASILGGVRRRDEPVRLTRIYTRAGDAGETSLGDGSRVPKTDPRIEAYGTVDELNSLLGLVLAGPLPDDFRPWLAEVQNDLFDLGADLSVPLGDRRERLRTSRAQVERLETLCDLVNERLEPLRSFVLPGGTEAAARLHVARAACRRAERLVVALAAESAVSPESLAYLNRLSDLLFILARAANAEADLPEPLWKPGKSR
jgi:cob(I)alamin adenosyltransferase